MRLLAQIAALHAHRPLHPFDVGPLAEYCAINFSPLNPTRNPAAAGDDDVLGAPEGDAIRPQLVFPPLPVAYPPSPWPAT